MIIESKQIYESNFPELARQFPLKEFQDRVISHVVNQGSAVAIMPTGGGKSLIYWVAAIGCGGTCIVVSPLIALIDEQKEKLENIGLKVLAIHSNMGASEQMKALKQFAKGETTPDFIFVSPERMATDGFFEYCIRLQKDKIKLLVVDEVHCISQWGFNFRPFYKRIPQFLDAVFSDSWPKILGLTATINPKELWDIRNDLKIPSGSVFKDNVLLRLDIDLKVEKIGNEDEKRERLMEILNENKGKKAIVYLYRKYYKGGVEELSEFANTVGIKSVAFHGDLYGNERQKIIKEYKEGKYDCVFATNAFGMGIDIPDIRLVIHYMLPESIEQYYQEIGRAGRDGMGASSYLLYSNKNIQVRRNHYINKSFPSGESFVNLFKRTTNNETGIRTLQYFAEEELQTALPYFLACGAISIEGKGFTGLKVFKTNTNTELQAIVGASRTGMVIPVLLKPAYSHLSCDKFFDINYSAIVNDEVILSKNLDKCLIIKAENNVLSVEQMAQIENDAKAKKEYKHNLLDYLVYLFDNFENSISLHQEIGRYLGVDKHTLNLIHQTESGIWVRSKSEVIIANILFRSNLTFRYEEKLFYDSTRWKEPDFTITHGGKTWYWEHLGMLGDEIYNEAWKNKKEIYQRLGIIDRVITTTESAVLSKMVNEKIQMILTAKPVA